MGSPTLASHPLQNMMRPGFAALTGLLHFGQAVPDCHGLVTDV